MSDLAYIQEMVRSGRDLFEEHYGIRTGGLSSAHAAACSQLPRRVQRLPSNHTNWTPHCIEGVGTGGRGGGAGGAGMQEVSEVGKREEGEAEGNGREQN